MDNHLTNLSDYDETHLGEALETQLWTTQKVRNLILGAVALGVLLFSLYSWLVRGEAKYQFPVLLCLLMICLLVYVNLSMPRKTAKAQAARIREANGGTRFRFAFREEDLLMTPPSNKESSPIGYEAFTRIIQTKNLILIFTNASSMLILDRAGFQNGSEEDFWTLIREKLPSIQIKKK